MLLAARCLGSITAGTCGQLHLDAGAWREPKQLYYQCLQKLQGVALVPVHGRDGLDKVQGLF